MTNEISSSGIIPELLPLRWKASSTSLQLHIVSILDPFWSFYGGKGIKKSLFPFLNF